MVELYFSRLREGASIPHKRGEDAGYDIFPCFEEDYLLVLPHQTVLVPTGLASAFSSDYYFQLFERSSTGSKGIAQRSGVIDSGYRGEWLVPITNTTESSFAIVKAAARERFEAEHPGIWVFPAEKAICQAVLLPVPKTEISEIPYEELCEIKSRRNKNGFGSTD